MLMDTITEILSNVFVDKKHKNKNYVSTSYNENNTYLTTLRKNFSDKEHKEIQTEPLENLDQNVKENEELQSIESINKEKYVDKTEEYQDTISEYSKNSSDSIQYRKLPKYNLDKKSVDHRNIIVVSENQEQMVKVMEMILTKLSDEKAIAILEKVDRDNFKKIILKNPDMTLNLLKVVKLLPKAIKENAGERIIIDYDFITDDFLKLLTNDSVYYLVTCNRLTKGINIVKNLLNDPLVLVYNDNSIDTFTKIIDMFDKISLNNYLNQDCDFFVLDNDHLYGLDGQ